MMTANTLDRNPSFVTLQALHQALAESFKGVEKETYRESKQHPAIQEINEFFEEVQNAVTHARSINDTEFLYWAQHIAGFWQTVMTTVLGIPMDIREKIGMDSGEIYQTIHSNKVEIKKHLEQHAYRIGASRKLLSLLRQVQFFSTHTDRIHVEISSSADECKWDWDQACMFLALDVIHGRISFRSIAYDSNGLELLDSVFLEDLVRLEAYLLWEKAHAGWTPERSESFFETAEQDILGKINPTSAIDPVLANWISDWYKNRLLIKKSAVWEQFRIERKSQRLCEACKLSEPHARKIASLQTDRFDKNIVIAINEGCDDSVAAVVDSVIGRSESLFRHCSTALEAIVLSRCLTCSETTIFPDLLSVGSDHDIRPSSQEGLP